MTNLSAPAVGVYTLSLNAEGIAAVQSWVDGSNTNNGIVLVNSATTDGIDLDSSEAISTTGRPKLSVTYAIPGGSAETVRSFQDGVFPDAAYAGSRDVSLVEAPPNTNVGSESNLFVDGDDPAGSGYGVAALISWDISSLSSASQVNAASIAINVSNPSGGSYELYEALTDWNEAEATWTAASNGIPWTVAGAQGAADRGSNVIGTVTASSTGSYQIDLNSNGVAVVQDWVNGVRPNHGFVLASAVTTDGVDFDSREAVSTTGRPKLSVTYAIPGGSTDTVVSFQDGVFPDAAYAGTRDVSLVEAPPNTNIGSESDLFVDGDDPAGSGYGVAALISWDISSLSPASQVNAASITINVSNPSSGSYELYEALTNWNEAEADWTAASNGTPWAVAGAQGAGDRGSDVLGTVTASSTGSYQLDLNSNGVAVVQDWVSGVRANHGFVLASAVTTNGVDFDSRESSTAVTRPKLTIAYAPSATSPSTSETFFYHTDHLGTPQVLTDATQSVAWKADYDPFGRASVTVGTIENNLRFPGQYFDAETGLHYNYFRFYDPSTGRYITSDPIGLAGGLNTYGYAYQNPRSIIDPMGLTGIQDDGSVSTIGRGLADLINMVDQASQIPGVRKALGIDDIVDAAVQDGIDPEILIRRGRKFESVTRLAKQCQNAENAGLAQNGVRFGHGVSVTSSVLANIKLAARFGKDPKDASVGLRAAFENAGFEVRDTPTISDKNHKTVIFSKPVSPEAARIFNGLLGRTRNR